MGRFITECALKSMLLAVFSVFRMCFVCALCVSYVFRMCFLCLVCGSSVVYAVSPSRAEDLVLNPRMGAHICDSSVFSVFRMCFVCAFCASYVFRMCFMCLVCVSYVFSAASPPPTTKLVVLCVFVRTCVFC